MNFIISNAPGTTYLSDKDGNSVLHIAAGRGHEALVECLMDTHNFGLIVGARYVAIHLYDPFDYCLKMFVNIIIMVVAIHLMG